MIAAPCSDESNTRRSELPSVTPKPRSSGSATMRAFLSASEPVSISGFSGRISSFQFRSITDFVSFGAVAGGGGSRQRGGGPIDRDSDAPTLGRPAAVVRNRSYVADGRDRHANRLQRPERRLATRAGA